MKRFLIDTPPPTISGNLHIGHIFSYTQGDLIAQYHKHQGAELVYPFCFDNNGIPTGKLANSKKIKGTQNIIDFSIKKSEEYAQTFIDCGINFAEQRYYTYNDLSIQIAYKAFEILKEKGIAYKAETEYLWSEKLQTSISQSELNEAGMIERTGEEPQIKTGEGWFINLKDHLPAIREKINEIDWKPSKHKKRIDDWCDSLEWDWSISRERNFGIQMPGEDKFTFDTWFISALTPQIAWSSHQGFEDIMGTPIFDMRFQSHDIIRTWAFYTIAMSYFLNNQIPWKTIMITGHVLDGNGDKFSKSQGNATPPKPLIDKYGINGLRFWAFSGALGNDCKIDEEKMKTGWRIKNKLKNAEKFINMQIENGWTGENELMLTSWKANRSLIFNYLENYDLDKANDQLYGFFWDTFCSKWIEISKTDSCSTTLLTIMEEMKPIINLFYGS